MTEAGLKSKTYVQALIRQCMVEGVFAAVLHRGDPDGGAVLVKRNMLENGCVVFTQIRTGDGRKAWMRGTGDAPVPEPEADAYVARQRGYDEDLWVIEVEDRSGQLPRLEPIV